MTDTKPIRGTKTDMQVVPTGGPLGAEVRGVDLASDPSGDTVFAVIESSRHHHLLLSRGTNHKRTSFDPSQRRVLHRVQIAGTRPF